MESNQEAKVEEAVDSGDESAPEEQWADEHEYANKLSEKLIQYLMK